MKKQKTIHQLPNTNIVIDYWKSLEIEGVPIRFMSIFRVEDDQLQCIKQNNYKIYTSCINKKLLEFHEIPADRIVAIEFGSDIEITDEHAGYPFKVSTIESNYCVGSCMFLFKGPFGNILYTSFFRPAKSSDPLRDPVLEPLIRDKLIDEVYIDNSYAAMHCQFPSRADVIKEAVHLIKEHPDHKIIIAGNKFGKEEVLRDIAMSLDEWIGVSKTKYEELLMMMPESSQKFTLHQDECRVVVEDESLSLKQCKEKQANEGLCIIILLTAQYICEEICNGTPVPQLSNLHILPYSSHASHCELMEFLYNLKARKILPIILTESENTIIPKKMVEMCYTNNDSLSLQDSDFYFNTVTNIPPSEDCFRTTNETIIPHLNCGNVTYNINHDTSMEITSHSSSRNELMDLDESLNIVEGDEIDSVDSNVFHEAESVAFITVLEVQDENLCHEDSYDAAHTVDPLSIKDSSDVSLVYDSIKSQPNLICTESLAKSSMEKFQDSSTTGSILEIGETNTASHSDVSPPNPTLISSSNLKNNQQQTLCDEDVCFDEISSCDIIGSDGLIGKHTEVWSNEKGPPEMEMEMDDGSGISLAISDHSGDRRSTGFGEESVNDEDERIRTVLYHVWLVTEAENWRRTNLTEDTWADLEGEDFI